MIQRLNLKHILFLDIETAPLYKTYAEVPEVEKELWAEKTHYQRKDAFSPEAFYPRAGIWAEFGKIICISVGYFTPDQSQRTFRITSFSGDEKELLLAFKSLLETYFFEHKKLLCAHNGKEFDFPYIARRMLGSNP